MTVIAARKGGRQERKKFAEAFKPRPYRPALQRKLGPCDYASTAQVERLHNASLRLLEEVGIEFWHQGAVQRWRDAGADVKETRVRIPSELLMKLVSTAPSEFQLQARNPAHTLAVGGDRTIFAPAYGPPYVRDFNDKRRVSQLEDLKNFYKLTQMSPVLHLSSGPTVEPVDVPVPQRHLDMVYNQIKLLDKPFMGAVTTGERAQDSVDMATITFGEAALEAGAVMISLLNCNSPLVWDEPAVSCMEVYGRANQAVICAPFVLAGASTPVSVTAAIAQLNAEVLAGVAYTQLVRPGAPVLYGTALHAVSMKTGAPMLGTPELGQMNILCGQLARRYKLPWRSCAQWTSAHSMDIQAGYESMFTTMSALLAGPSLLIHCAGIIENNLSTSFTKFVLDDEQLEQIYLFASDIGFEDFDEAFETVFEVGPANHFMGTEHTRTNMFFHPPLQDTSSYGEWEEKGEKTAVDRAHQRVQDILQAYQPPPLPQPIDERLLEFMAVRREQVGTKVT